jgi:hypothetical protein
MKTPLFSYPSYQYQISDWNFKKKSLLNRINSQKFVRTPLQTFESDRSTNKKSYVHYLAELLSPELNEFCQEAEVTCMMTDAWTVRYHRGDYQTVHNHRSFGFSAILYLEYDPKVHTPTTFICPWQDPRNDTTTLICPQDVKEGTLVIVPSYTLHYATPNLSHKTRTVISADLLPKLPDHQTINN